MVFFLKIIWLAEAFPYQITCLVLFFLSLFRGPKSTKLLEGFIQQCKRNTLNNFICLNLEKILSFAGFPYHHWKKHRFNLDSIKFVWITYNYLIITKNITNQSNVLEGLCWLSSSKGFFSNDNNILKRLLYLWRNISFSL